MTSQLKAWFMLFFTFLILIVFSSCDENSESTEPATEKVAKAKPMKPLWRKFIRGHSSGLVSKKGKVRIRFLSDIIEKKQVAKSAASIIEISPKFEGTITFSNTKEISIIPKKEFRRGQRYLVKIKVDKLVKLPKELGDYEFNFQVIKQEYEVKIAGLDSNPGNDNEMILKGSLITADIEEAAKIKEIVSAKYNNKSMKIVWQHNPNGKRHEFTITKIIRQKKEQTLKLIWNGKVIGVKNKGSKDIKIPAQGVFQITDIREVYDKQQYIVVYFSDNINKNQSLKGLIRLSNKKSFTTLIEGNKIKIFLDRKFVGKVTVILEPGIKNTKGSRLKKQMKKLLVFKSHKPQVRFAGKGVILPDNDVLSIPFEAVNVHSVQVTAFLIYDNNIGQFLQTNKLEGDSEIDRVGRYLWRKTINLPTVQPDKWNQFTLDATELLRNNPGGLFRLTLSINRGNSIFGCKKADAIIPIAKEDPIKNSEDINLKEASGWDGIEDYYDDDEGDGSTWNDRDNPCKDAYYRHGKGVKASRNFIGSNIGIISKLGQNGELHVITTNLQTSEPMKDVQVSFMNFQNQVMETVTTDAQGFAKAKLSGTPFYCLAERDKEKGYLKMSQGSLLPVSHFNVGGEKIQAGIKGYIYGERGVWRPGDKIYLTFVLEDKGNKIPPKHPVTMKLYNPQGQLMKTITNSNPVEDFYAFTLKTADQAVTGNWKAVAHLGGSTFSKRIKVETIVPNRLKVELDFGGETLYQSKMPVEGKLFGQWLHGATASKLKADVKVRLKSIPTKFGRFTDHTFDDPTRIFSGDDQTIFDGQLDEKGYATINKEISAGDASPGMLSAYFTTRVFEASGAFSSSRKKLTLHPYKNYVGIKLPKGDQSRNMLMTDKEHTVSIVSLDDHGKPVSLKKLEVTLYKINWKWWWDKSDDNLAEFASANHTKEIQKGVISTEDGQGEWNFEIKYPSWGRYLIRVCDPEGRHCTAKIFYIDWPGWAGKAREGGGVGASILNFTSDKKEYKVNEVATIKLPETSQGRALMSVENGSKILEQKWLQLSKGNTQFDLPISEEMSPNCFVSVTLIQPHQSKNNDRPIRLYGIIPIKVYNPKTKLKPVIKAADEWEPRATVSLTVSEASGQPMTYTLAIVDEGLLGLTSFKTPDLHKQFYKKEALGVKTWDLFDSVVGAYGGELERLLALGGDGEESEPAGQEDKKRFPPVVQFLGPFKLDGNDKTKHEIKLPQYVGAVRVMVVAGEQGAYGFADKSIFVRKPLTLLATLPRVIGPEEELTVPVTLFVMDKKIKNVTLKVEADKHFQVIGKKTVQVRFTKPGEKMGFLKLKVKQNLGKAALRFTATSGKHQAWSDIHIDVRSPNPKTVRQYKKTIEPGDSWEDKIVPHGLAGTNLVSLEMSAVPPLNLESRLHYLIRYPHGCVEQVTSAVFPQIYLNSLVRLTDKEKKNIEKNIKIGVKRLRQFQINNGGFVYWPGGYFGGGVSTWATNYVGHFLIEADKMGYYVPGEMINDWLKHQKSLAQAWTEGHKKKDSKMSQAYRLYTLALANKSEIGAMNRFREASELDSASRWLLAAAYKLAGLSDAADDLIQDHNYTLADYVIPGNTFGSKLRDKAIILTSLLVLEESDRAEALAEEISNDLFSAKWHSTHSLAFSLMAMSKYIGAEKKELSFSFDRGIGVAALKTIKSNNPIYSQKLTKFPLSGEVITIKNRSERNLYASVIVKGIPKAGKEAEASSGLNINVSYTDTKGNTVQVGELRQGKDFMATITVTNKSNRKLANIALTHIVPSGWEIHNARFDSDKSAKKAKIDYQDIRDDRIYTYFGLNPGEKKTITTLLNAAYLGKHYLPGISVEAMYDATKHARLKGQWVQVVKELTKESKEDEEDKKETKKKVKEEE